jgi:hypothetical protein
VKKHVQVLLPEIQDTLAFTVNVDFFRSPVAEPGKDLVAGIGAVQGEPGGEPEIERAFEDFGLVFKVGEETVDLPDIDRFVADLAGLFFRWYTVLLPVVPSLTKILRVQISFNSRRAARGLNRENSRYSLLVIVPCSLTYRTAFTCRSESPRARSCSSV